MRSYVSLSARFSAGLLFLACAACSRATTPAPASATAPANAAPAAANAVLGSWSRTPEGCKRPEFQLGAADVAIQTDGDGTPVTFKFRKVAWSTDAPDLATVELNEPHPYGKAPSKTALTFKVVDADDVALVQRTHSVPLHRCPAH